MRLFGLVLASIIMFSVIGINETFALNCMADDSCSVDQIANVFDIIFLGNVISTEQNKVSFNVEKTWIGIITENKDMTMICQNLNCELSFVVDEDYLVIGFYRDTVPTVSGKLSKLASDAKEDLKILNDSNFQTNHIDNLELLKKLKETQDNGIFNLIEGFTPSLIFVDTFNLELVIGLSGNLTQEDAEYYEIQLKEIVGDIPMNVGFSPGGIREDVLRLERIYAPLKQIKDGVSFEEIKCKRNLQLIFKSLNNSPACVKPQTAEKLMERGWAVDETNQKVESKELPELLEPSMLREGDFWIINYDYSTESFPIDSLNKELRTIYGLRDHQLDPILKFDTLDRILERNSYLKYDDYSVDENTFGLLLYGDSDPQERVLSEKLFKEIPGVTNAQFHDVWSVRLIL